MSHLAATVVIVISEVDGRPWGMTISSCCSVSVRPPTILISLGADTASARSIRAQARFGASILGRRGRQAALAAAATGAPKFAEEYCVRDGDPGRRCSYIARGALAHLDCHVVKQVDAADHVVFIGEVGDVIMFNGERPLLYYARDYAFVEDEAPWWS